MVKRNPTRNEHWQFVRKTFRLVYLVRSFALVSSHTRANINVDTAVVRMLEDARRRRHLFFKKILVNEGFVGKMLGIDRSGMCIRHPKQLICKFPQFEATEKYLKKQPPIVKSCPICRSNSSPEGSGHINEHHPAMVNATGEVQELQSDRKEWKKVTATLGMGERDYKNNTNAGSPMKQKEKRSSSDMNVNKSDEVLLKSDDVAAKAKWIESVRIRILQVRSWPDRFALKNHPIFCEYFKMLQFGVSIDVAKFAVKADGYDPSIMDLAPNIPLELQGDQLDRAALENLRSKGIPTKEKGKEEANSDDDSDLDCADGSAEVNIQETMRRFLSVIRRRRSSQIFAISALLDNNEHLRRLEKGKNHRGSSSRSFYKQQQLGPEEKRYRTKPIKNPGSDFPLHVASTPEQNITQQQVGKIAKASKGKNSKTSDRKSIEQRHSQRKSTTTKNPGKEHRKSESKSNILANAAREHNVSHQSQRRSTSTDMSGHINHNDVRASTTTKKSGNGRHQNISNLETIDKKSRGNREERSSIRIDKPHAKHVHSERTSRTKNVSGGEHHQSQRRVETLEKDGLKIRKSQMKSKINDTLGQEQSKTMDTSGSKDYLISLGRSSQLHGFSQMPPMLSNTSGCKHQKHHKGLINKPNTHIDATGETLIDSITTVSNNDGEHRTKMIKWISFLLRKEEVSTNKEEPRPKVMKSGNKSIVKRALQIIRRPSKKPGPQPNPATTNPTKEESEIKKQHNVNLYDDLEPEPRSKTKPKMELNSKDPTWNPPVKEVIISNPPEPVSPLKDDKYFKPEAKSMGEIRVYAPPEPVSPMKESRSKHYIKSKAKSMDEIERTKTFAKTAIDGKGSNTKVDAAITDVESKGHHMEGVKQPKSPKSPQKVTFVKNNKINDLRQELKSREDNINDLLRRELRRRDSIIMDLRQQVKEMKDDTDRRRGISSFRNSMTDKTKKHSSDNQIRTTPDAVADAPRERKVSGKKGNGKKSNGDDDDEGSNYEQVLLDCIQRLRDIEDVDVDKEGHEFVWSI